jgi:hypothetical protein
MVRLAVLRLASVGVLYAKEIESPVVMALVMLEPLSDLQLRHLANASPWAPVMVEASVDDKWHNPGFGACISFVETLPKIPAIPPKKRLRNGLIKRKRGFLFHD